MKKICPFMSYQNPGALQPLVECVEDQCALWEKYQCGLINENKDY